MHYDLIGVVPFVVGLLAIVGPSDTGEAGVSVDVL